MEGRTTKRTRGKASRQTWGSGDVFAIENTDGRYSVGQVLAAEPEALNAVSVAIFAARLAALTDVEELSLAVDDAISIVLTTPDQLKNGTWRIVARRPVAVPRERFPFEHTRPSGFVGAKVYGSGIVTELTEAYVGLAPWDDWADPGYLDRLLVAPSKKPPRVTLKARGVTP